MHSKEGTKNCGCGQCLIQSQEHEDKIQKRFNILAELLYVIKRGRQGQRQMKQWHLASRKAVDIGSPLSQVLSPRPSSMSAVSTLRSTYFREKTASTRTSTISPPRWMPSAKNRPRFGTALSIQEREESANPFNSSSPTHLNVGGPMQSKGQPQQQQQHFHRHRKSCPAC